MSQERTFLAIDLGAESGRAVLGRLRNGKLALEEIRRFANEPLPGEEGLRWNAPRLWQEVQAALQSVGEHGVERLDTVGVDTWGVDYALLGEDGALLENPRHYRDTRHHGVMERVLARLPAESIYGITGIQFLPFNTLYQLVAAAEHTPELLARARHFLTMPDLFHYWMTGRVACERTNASTTQFLDARARQWSRELLDRAGVPAHFLPPLVEAGTALGPLRAEMAAGHPALAQTQVIAPACHDTGSAFAALHSGGTTALLSSGTWSLLGVEMAAPVITSESLRLNFTNEGGACGTTRLLKNIAGMWLLERCRRAWTERGTEFSYPELMDLAAREKPFQHWIDPDDSSFARPEDMPGAIAGFCARTGQAAPRGPGAFTRAILESLAMKYRCVLESLESLAGAKFREIRVAGGGAQNNLLNRFTANATGCRVLAGPVEATALGNLAMQMVGSGAAPSLAEARRIIAASFPPHAFEPQPGADGEQALSRFRALLAPVQTTG